MNKTVCMDLIGEPSYNPDLETLCTNTTTEFEESLSFCNQILQ